MDCLQVLLLFIFLAKLGHVCRRKQLEANDGFLLAGWLVLMMHMRRQRNVLEFTGAGDLSPDALSHLNCMLSQMYSNEGIVTFPGNVHIKGDLCVGTYMDEDGNEKNFIDSCEHTCVWRPKKNGINDTTGAKWIHDSSKSPAWKSYCKPFRGGGVFSFRAGHVDLHPIFISRKQARTATDAEYSTWANTVNKSEYYSWNPTRLDDVWFKSYHDYLEQENKNQNIVGVSNLHVDGHTWLNNGVRLSAIKEHPGNSVMKPAGDTTYGWIKSNQNWLAME